MRFTEHLIFLALLTPTVALLSAAVVSLAVPMPGLNTAIDVHSRSLTTWAPAPTPINTDAIR